MFASVASCRGRSVCRNLPVPAPSGSEGAHPPFRLMVRDRAELGGFGNRVLPTAKTVEFAEIDGQNSAHVKVSSCAAWVGRSFPVTVTQRQTWILSAAEAKASWRYRSHRPSRCPAQFAAKRQGSFSHIRCCFSRRTGRTNSTWRCGNTPSG